MSEIDYSRPPGKNFSHHTLRMRGREFRVWEAGSGDPLVWLHGAGGVVLSYAMDRLAGQYRVLLPEMPGWGPCGEVPTSMAQMRDTLADLLSHQGLSRYHLGGTSLGAAVALHIAAGRGEALDSLVLESPYALRVGGENPTQHSPQQMREMLNARPDRVAWRSPLGPCEEQLSVMQMLTSEQNDSSIAEALPSIHTRTLVIFGGLDRITPATAAPTFEQRLPDCRYVNLPRAAHDAQGDCPSEFVDAVEQFLGTRLEDSLALGSGLPAT
jgi:pimeloyl-ACP methyl ester carboxylesterase